ncbi:hypothetical protein MRB53_019986 [Persea americana]|uniref:Uncharacterized protein n=1 Tax=Persea americana TaxID=3435 RepID=A0ACC2KZM0_PERAE|nr:hypothetical protein MRB53_019986 [Persea americana]
MSFLAETWVVVVVSGMCFSLDVGNPEAPPLGIVVVVLALAAAQTSTMMIIKIIESLKRDAEEEKAMDSSTTAVSTILAGGPPGKVVFDVAQHMEYNHPVIATLGNVGSIQL